MARPDEGAVTTREQPPLSLDVLCSADRHHINDSPGTENGGSSNAAVTTSTPRCNCKYVQRASWVEHIACFCSLSIFAYVGMLARVYLTQLSAWNGLPLFSAFYPEVVGTTIMGIVISHKKLLEANYKALYQGLATGLCGSITTFAAWNDNAAVVLVQYNQDPPDNATRFIGWITIIILGVSGSVAALRFGGHLGSISPWSDQRSGERVYLKPTTWFRLIETLTLVIIWLLTTVVVVAIPLIYQRYDFIFSFILASLGTYTRWHLAPWNTALRHFKLGTFMANILSTLILGTASVLEEHYDSDTGRVVEGLIFGVRIGLCGSLSTVSTFIVELTSLSRADSYVYGVVSIAIAQIALLVIRGTYWWTTT